MRFSAKSPGANQLSRGFDSKSHSLVNVFAFEEHLAARNPQVKPGFHMIVRIVRIVPVVSKNFETIGTTETIAGFHTIASIASKTEDARSSAMFLGSTTEFWRNIRKRNGGRRSHSESPGLLSSYSFDFAP